MQPPYIALRPPYFLKVPTTSSCGSRPPDKTRRAYLAAHALVTPDEISLLMSALSPRFPPFSPKLKPFSKYQVLTTHRNGRNMADHVDFNNFLLADLPNATDHSANEPLPPSSVRQISFFFADHALGRRIHSQLSGQTFGPCARSADW